MFFKVQDVLSGRKRDFSVKKVCPDNLPLRGFILCPECNKQLTGSASKGRGGYYYYYHCKAPCNVRIKADIVNDWMERELEKFIPKAGVADLYREIVSDLFGNKKDDRDSQRRSLISQVTEQNNRITRLREMLLSDKIDSEDYKSMKGECDNLINRVESELAELADDNKKSFDYEVTVNQVVNGLLNLKVLYNQGDIKNKQFIIGSIFQEKWVFSENKGRTTKINEAATLIYLINNDLRHKKPE